MKSADTPRTIPFVKIYEEKLIDALRIQGVDIYTYKDIHNFLIGTSHLKKNAERWLCWMITLHIIPLNRYKWGPKMFDIQEYWEIVQYYFKSNPQNPLSVVSLEFEEIIQSDIESGKMCIFSTAEDLSISKESMSDAIFRIQRIFAVIIKESESKSGFQYMEGFSALAAITYAVNLKFAEEGKLNKDYAEAACYYMLRSIISILPFTRIASTKETFLAHFEEVDNAIREEAPEQAKLIERNNTQSFIYAKSWEAVLFVTLHNARDTIIIWDQILGRMERLTDIVESILIAHIIQATLPQNPINVTEFIENYSTWNLEQLISDALRIMEHQKTCKQEMLSFFCPKLKKYHGYQLHGIF